MSAAPASQTVQPGGSAAYTLTVTPSGGFSGTVTFAASGVPSGASASFNPASVTVWPNDADRGHDRGNSAWDLPDHRHGNEWNPRPNRERHAQRHRAAELLAVSRASLTDRPAWRERRLYVDGRSVGSAEP